MRALLLAAALLVCGGEASVRARGLPLSVGGRRLAPLRAGPGSGGPGGGPGGGRKIVGRDNLGEPIYEGDEPAADTLSVFGVKLANVDPISGTLFVFGLLALQFFVIANL